MYLIIMKYILLTLIFALLVYSCTQVNNAPQSEAPLRSVRYNLNFDSTSYDSGWVQYEDTLIIVDDTINILDTVALTGFDSTSVASWSIFDDSLVVTSVPLARIDTFFLKQHVEKLFSYGEDTLVSTVIWDTVARAYTQMGFVYSYVVGGDTLSYAERFPESVVSSSSTPVVSVTPSSGVSSVAGTLSTGASSAGASSTGASSTGETTGSVASTLSSSRSTVSSAVSGSGAVSSSSTDPRYVVIEPITQVLLDSLDDDDTNYQLYLLLYYNQSEGALDIDIDKIVLRYKEDYDDEVVGTKFDSLSIGDVKSYNETSNELTMEPGDSAFVRMYYSVDTTKTVMRVSYKTYDDNIFGILDSTAYTEYLQSFNQ